MLSIKLLPESIGFLAVTGAATREISAIVERIAPELRGLPLAAKPSTADRPRKLPVKHLFTEGRAVGTILLWIPFFMNLLIIYFIVSWLPGLLRQAGNPLSIGVAAVALFSVGGIIGTLAQGPLMAGDRMGWFLSLEFAISAFLIALLAFASNFFALTLVVTLILGISVQGAQAGLNALAASFYPTPIRATGLGWASGIGRLGSIVGPTLGGALLSMHWTPRQIFLAATLPALGAAAAAFMREGSQPREIGRLP